MIDIRVLRADPGAVKAALGRRGVPSVEVDEIAGLDEQLRAATARRDELRARVRLLSKDVEAAYRAGERDRAEKLRQESRDLGEDERAADASVGDVAQSLRDRLLLVPNIPADGCPDGDSPDDNVVLRIWSPADDEGVPAYEEHQRVPHWEIGSALEILDLERGAKLSGSMFPMFRRDGATLARALVQFGLERNRDAFEEIRPPTLVRTETMISTGHLPKFADDAYHLERDDLWAIPTAEVPLTSLARDEVLPEADLPLRLMAFTSCFRREAGSAGRDTRGLLRVHEFDKVEILAYSTPEQAADVHIDLLARAEGALQALGLTYRVVDLCTGDLGTSAARTFDLEVYAPGCDQWLEASSVSWFSDYQARRANVRYRPAEGSGTSTCHTLNASALAVPRVWAALVETYRRADGSVGVPDVLRAWFGGRERMGVA
ncbi:MAG TPA: serine--tRNA ligase [Acidimicrobiales bacterium]|nr:serine--tRNA ligase [Acidimicrobiales bacterium]